MMQADEFHAQLMQDPAFVEAYRLLDPNGQIAQAIVKRRLDLGITQATLSKLSGVSVMTINNYEHLVGNPTIDTLRRLADALGCKLNISFEILGEGSDEQARV